jgi:hypothetical protein
MYRKYLIVKVKQKVKISDQEVAKKTPFLLSLELAKPTPVLLRYSNVEKISFFHTDRRKTKRKRCI